MFRELTLQAHMSTITLVKNSLYLMNNFNCCCEIVKLTHLPGNNGIATSVFVHLTQQFSNKNYCSYFYGIIRHLFLK